MTGSVSGSAHQDADNNGSIPVASSDVEFGIEFGVAGPTPVTVTVSLNASNSDDSDCTEAEATFVGDEASHTARKFAGGDCSGSGGGSASFSGVIVSSGSLDVSLSGSVDADDGAGTET